MYGILARSDSGATTRLDDIRFRARTNSLEDNLKDWLFDEFAGRIAISSSFGSESAALLHLVARIDRGVPVLFVDTGQLFPETLAYRDILVERLRLTNVRTIAPLSDELEREDPEGTLWSVSNDACCALRKVRPYQNAIRKFDALITGRKRVHGAARGDLDLVGVTNGQFRINPLYDWGTEKIENYLENFGLPRHPLVVQGYASIGCTHCTAKAEAGNSRSGRWSGSGKTECGIHLSTGWTSLRR